MEIMAVVLASFFLQLGSHYIPWAQIVGKRKLHRLAAYVIGTLTIGLTFSIWALSRNEMPSLIEFWIIVVSSGAGVGTGYLLDWIIVARDRAHDLKQENSLLMEQRDEPESRS